MKSKILFFSLIGANVLCIALIFPSPFALVNFISAAIVASGYKSYFRN